MNDRDRAEAWILRNIPGYDPIDGTPGLMAEFVAVRAAEREKHVAALRLAVEAMIRADIHIAQVSQPDHEMLTAALAACRKVVGE